MAEDWVNLQVLVFILWHYHWHHWVSEGCKLVLSFQTSQFFCASCIKLFCLSHKVFTVFTATLWGNLVFWKAATDGLWDVPWHELCYLQQMELSFCTPHWYSWLEYARVREPQTNDNQRATAPTYLQKIICFTTFCSDLEKVSRMATSSIRISCTKNTHNFCYVKRIRMIGDHKKKWWFC